MLKKQLKILTVVGARPQFIKAAMVSRAIIRFNREEEHTKIIEEIIHTGQHFDESMSDIFFSDMGIPRPVSNLNVNNVSHGEMTGRMLVELEREMLAKKPDWVLVYGDTNSTLAGALAAAKLHIPVAHVESGLRSFNKRMPEEINRILTDHVSTLLFCPTETAVENLNNEGITNNKSQIPDNQVPSVIHIGDVMYDAALVFGKIADQKSNIIDELNNDLETPLSPKEFALITCHREENTDDSNRLKGILDALEKLSQQMSIVFPIHPRTAKRLQKLDHPTAKQICLSLNGEPGDFVSKISGIIAIQPVSFLDMVKLEMNARIILTDSGGIQKEAYFHGVPCVTLRDETEWVETVSAGWNTIAGAAPDRIVSAALKATKGKAIAQYGDGHASERIVKMLV